jgi:hypothetical protein
MHKVDQSKTCRLNHSGQGRGIYQRNHLQVWLAQQHYHGQRDSVHCEGVQGLLCSGIKINYSSVSHPQINGQVEHSNGMIRCGLKLRIFDRLKPYVGKWVKELPSVLWALLSHPEFPISECEPFFLINLIFQKDFV